MVLCTRIHNFFLAGLALIIAMAVSLQAVATERVEAVALAQDVMRVAQATQHYKASNSDSYSRAVNIVLGRDMGSLSRLLSEYNEDTLPYHDMFETYDALSIEPLNGMLETASYIKLSAGLQSEDWRRQYHAQLLLSVAHLLREDKLKGLEFIYNAIETINAQEINAQNLVMMYNAYDVLHNAHILDFNLDETLATIETLKSLAVEAKKPLDGFTLVNNISVIFSYADRIEDAFEILKVLEPYVSAESDENKSIYYFSMGRLSNLLENYEEAIAHLEHLFPLSEEMFYLPNIYEQLALSYVHIGDIEKSQKFLASLELLSYGTELESSFALPIMHLKARIEEGKGNYKDSLEIQKKYTDEQVSFIGQALTKDRKEATERIALSQRLADEKLSNAMRENVLKDEIIDREKNITRAILLLLGLAMITLTICYLGLRKMKALNAELIISRDQALMAERAKTNFLAVMSHEVRTPLNSIIPVAELLRDKPIYHQDKDLLSLIVSGGTILLQMLDNILVVSKEGTSSEALNADIKLAQFAVPILRPFAVEAKKKGVDFQAHIARGCPASIFSDRLALENILTNMLSNAVKFTSKGAITTRFDPVPGEDAVQISIRDTGVGMDPSKIEAYLEPFTQEETGITRSFDGLGIGLSVIHIEVERLGGTLRFITDHDIGTEVIIKLPIGQDTKEGSAHMAMAA